MISESSFSPEQHDHSLETNPSETQDQTIAKKIESEPRQEARITIQFVRHQEKDKSGELTPEGRKAAIAQSPDEDTNTYKSRAYGSSVGRTRHTVELLQHGHNPTITGEEEFGELEDKIINKIGSSIAGTKEKLGTPKIPDPEFQREMTESVANNKYIDFLIHESDQLSKQLESGGENYSHKAAQISELLEQYLHILDRWKVVQEGKEAPPNLQRFMGTHGGVQECFLAKVVELTDGQNAKEEFIQSLPSGNGFDFGEGMTVEIKENEKGEKVAHIEYKNQEFQISKDIDQEFLDLIIDQDEIRQS